jgi:GNAT superfamily N-acetyltransferase
MEPQLLAIRPIVESDWREYRALRIRMLQEIPLAFGETYAVALTVRDEGWRARAGRSTGGNSVRFAAIDNSTGEWVGTMGGFLSAHDDNVPILVGVYVVPGYRGSIVGVTDGLLSRVESWAHQFGDVILLHVHSENPRAIAAYEKRGFVRTGVTIPYVLDTNQIEIEMSKSL